MSRMKQVLITLSLIVIIGNIATGSTWKDDAKAIDISGGEDHTLLLSANKWAWACGPNGGTGYAGVLGTGSGSSGLIEKSPLRVSDGNMNTPSEYLESIIDVDAGWVHSLALENYDPNDPNYNGYVWAWGNNYWGATG